MKWSQMNVISNEKVSKMDVFSNEKFLNEVVSTEQVSKERGLN